MTTPEKKIEPIVASEIQEGFPTAGASNYADTFIDNLDHEKIARIEKELSDLKEKNSKKVYAVNLSSDLLESLINFIENDCDWSQMESLGVLEIHKTLLKVKSEGVRDNTIFLNGLPLEAIHYFLSKRKGRGLKEAEDFLSLYKPLSISLEEVKTDAARVQSMEKELAAAQQGIEAI